MPTASRFNCSQMDELPADLLELASAIGQLPPAHRDKLQPALGRVVDSTMRRRRILCLVQDALSQLRLDMKYLVFDLEATRRERDAYRQSLDHGPLDDGPLDDGPLDDGPLDD